MKNSSSEKDRCVLLFGATGKTGIQIGKVLHKSKINFFAFVRPSSKEKMKDAAGEIIVGDVMNEVVVENAIKLSSPTDIVISLGSSSLKNAKIRASGTAHIINALANSGMKAHLHVVSALGVGDSWGQLGLFGKLISTVLLGSVMKDHNQQEVSVKQSHQAFHIIRPVGLKDGMASGKVRVIAEGKMPYNEINRSDVAEYIVESMKKSIEGYSSICKYE